MFQVSDETFQELVNQALEELPGDHAKGIENIAILFQDLPDVEQRESANLLPNQTLLGLYQGVPLSDRQGMTRMLPDKITLFKLPLQAKSTDLASLREEIKHTLWHEIAHYYGLDHERISELE